MKIEKNILTEIMPDISVGIVNYNGMEALPETIRSVKSSLHPIREIVVVDNGSTDGSREWLEKEHQEIKCVALGRNAGSAEARNILIKMAAFEYIFLLDNDISLEPETAGKLVKIMSSLPDAGICHPEIKDESDPEVYHYNGGSIHYLGALIARKRPNPDENRGFHEKFDVVSGGAIMIRKTQTQLIGGFDDAFFFNWEDGDFSARMTLAGLLCLNVPDAIVHHQGKSRGTSKVFYQVRNRWFFMLKLYNARTLFLILPMLCLFEIMQAALLLKKKAWRAYWRGNMAVIKALPDLIKKRREFKKLKKTRDSAWLKSGMMYVPAAMSESGGLQRWGERFFYGLCRAYWAIVKQFC